MDPNRTNESKPPVPLSETNTESKTSENEPNQLKQIRTFQGDVAEALKSQRESLVSIQQTEHLRKKTLQSDTDDSLEDTNKRKTFFLLLLGSFLLFILSAGGVWFGYSQFIKKSSTPIATAPSNRFVSSSQEVTINLRENTSRGNLIDILSGAASGSADGEIKHIIITKENTERNENYLLPTDELLKILETKVPPNLARAFDPLFMFGTLGESRFLIIKLTSFENAFAGILTWEKDLKQDIGPLFSTAGLLRNLSPETDFIDITDNNKDVRAITLGNQPILLYSFLDNNILIITDKIDTLRTLIDRITREKLSR
jgi:hypothetical protein